MNSMSEQEAVTEVVQSKIRKYCVVDYMRVDDNFAVVRFIFECSNKLGAKVLTAATAVGFFHKFCKNSADSSAYDKYLVAASCLYLAGKVEDNDYLRIRDIINVVYTTLHRDKEHPLVLESEYYNIRAAIVQTELLLLRILKFQTKHTHPHPYLLHYLRSLKDWISGEVWLKFPIATTSWSLLQDSYYDARLVLETDPSHLSLACIHLSLLTYGIQLPYVSDSSNRWYKIFNEEMIKKDVWEILLLLMEVYTKETVLLPSSVLQTIFTKDC